MRSPSGILIALAVFAGPLSAQAPTDPQPPAPEQALRVFLDCQLCDFDHFRREVGYVNYVRDRQDAQLHVLVTTRPTGGGGTEYTFAFIGIEPFEGRQDTLVWASRQGDTQDEVREGLTRTFQLGLMPYVADTPLADLIRIEYEAPTLAEQVLRPEDDPWNFWVFEVSVGGSIEGEERQRDASLDGSVEASRVTEDLKVELESEVEWNQDRFELSDGEILTTTTRDYSTEALVVWSLGPHWSTGVDASAVTTTRENQDLTLRAGPALEYSLYPYGESTRRQITLLYTLEVVSFDYEETTLFDRTSETRVEQAFEIGADFTQPWGEISGSLEAEMFLDDPSQHRIDLFSNLELRITRGLSLDIQGSVARVKNQIYISREDVSDEDILLERRQLGTDYEYELEVGLSFTFGSVFNNVVNPRIQQGGGGRFFF